MPPSDGAPPSDPAPWSPFWFGSGSCGGGDDATVVGGGLGCWTSTGGAELAVVGGGGGGGGGAACCVLDAAEVAGGAWLTTGFSQPTTVVRRLVEPVVVSSGCVEAASVWDGVVAGELSDGVVAVLDAGPLFEKSQPKLVELLAARSGGGAELGDVSAGTGGTAREVTQMTAPATMARAAHKATMTAVRRQSDLGTCPRRAIPIAQDVISAKIPTPA